MNKVRMNIPIRTTLRPNTVGATTTMLPGSGHIETPGEESLDRFHPLPLPAMKHRSGCSLLAPVFAAQVPNLLLAPIPVTQAAPVSCKPWEGSLGNGSRAPAPRPVEGASIYAVDDNGDLTELYSLLLAGAGYKVQAFTQRMEALAALKADGAKPDLLITDYFGVSMPVEQFMHACRVIHPNLRILMASGFSRTDEPCSWVRPDRFIRKPFTPEEFLVEVKAVLAA
jgi:CheY-like chemotaxis protein